MCFDCHAEVGHYNDKHPRGNKFSANELQGHRDQWLEICKNNPGNLVAAPRTYDQGPLEALLDEIEHNISVVNTITNTQYPEAIPLLDQHRNALKAGSLSMLPDELKASIQAAYASTSTLRECVCAVIYQNQDDFCQGRKAGALGNALTAAKTQIPAAKDKLLAFLQ